MGLYPGGTYIRNNIFVSLYPGVFKPGGGALTWDSTIPDWLRDRWIDDFIILINSSIQRQRTARNNQRKRTNKKR